MAVIGIKMNELNKTLWSQWFIQRYFSIVRVKLQNYFDLYYKDGRVIPLENFLNGLVSSLRFIL